MQTTVRPFGFHLYCHKSHCEWLPTSFLQTLATGTMRNHSSSSRRSNLSNIESVGRRIGISGFCTTFNKTLPLGVTSNNSICNDIYHKAFRKGKRTTTRVVQLLSEGPQSRLQPSEKTDTSTIEISFMAAHGVALVGGPPCEGRVRDMEGIRSFQKIDFHFSNPSARRGIGISSSTQYLQFSCPSLNVDESLHTKHVSATFDCVEMVSGVCLFSSRVLHGSFLQDGQADVQSLSYQAPTLFEMEYIARSSSAIADVASLVISRGEAFQHRHFHACSIPVRATLDGPSFHYYQAIDAKIERGMCTPAEAVQWMEAIELRHDQIAAVFEESVRYELRQRGVASPHTCPIHVTPRSCLVATSIRQALQDGRRPSLADILQRLNKQGDGVWQEFYKFLPKKEKPEDFWALGYLFYVLQVIRPALAKSRSRLRRWSSPDDLSETAPKTSTQQSPSSQTKTRNHRLIISIDDGMERRIYSRAQKLLKRIRNSSDTSSCTHLIEMYMCRRVFINNNETGSLLYAGDPSPHSPTLSNGSHDSCNGSYPHPKLEPIDIIRNLYGSQCAMNLRRWFREVGL